MTSSPAIQHLYAGGTLALTGLYSSSTIGGAAPNADCQFSALFEVSYTGSGGYVSSGDYFTKIVSASTAPSGTGTTSAITFIADVATFGSGTSTSTISVSVRVTYSVPGQSASKTFTVFVMPTSALVQLSSAQTSTLISISSGANTDQTYTVGDNALSIAAPVFDATTAPTDATYSNTNLPA